MHRSRNWARRANIFMRASIVFFFLSTPASAAPAVFHFFQTSTSIPDFSVTADIWVSDGHNGLNLPTVAGGLYTAAPYNFGNLVGLHVESSDLFNTYSLADFVAPCDQPAGCGSALYGFPWWSISPQEIDFVNAGDSEDFKISFLHDFSTIEVDQDNGALRCYWNGACVVTGYWATDARPPSVPEPSGALLAVSGLLLGAPVIRKRRERRTAAAGR